MKYLIMMKMMEGVLEKTIRTTIEIVYWKKNIILHEISPHPSQKITVNTTSICEEPNK